MLRASPRMGQSLSISVVAQAIGELKTRLNNVVDRVAFFARGTASNQVTNQMLTKEHYHSVTTMPDEPTSQMRNPGGKLAAATIGDLVTEKPPSEVRETLRVGKETPLTTALHWLLKSVPNQQFQISSNLI